MNIFSLCIVVKLQNISCWCQHYKRSHLFVRSARFFLWI
jgi:hypothetical protein